MNREQQTVSFFSPPSSLLSSCFLPVTTLQLLSLATEVLENRTLLLGVKTASAYFLWYCKTFSAWLGKMVYTYYYRYKLSFIWQKSTVYWSCCFHWFCCTYMHIAHTLHTCSE